MKETIITISVGLVTALAGFITGFYKTKSELGKTFITKEACDQCAMRNEVNHLVKDIRKAGNELSKGADTFQQLLVNQTVLMKDIEAINKDISNICTKVNGIKSQISELR